MRSHPQTSESDVFSEPLNVFFVRFRSTQSGVFVLPSSDPFWIGSCFTKYPAWQLCVYVTFLGWWVYVTSNSGIKLGHGLNHLAAVCCFFQTNQHFRKIHCMSFKGGVLSPIMICQQKIARFLRTEGPNDTWCSRICEVQPVATWFLDVFGESDCCGMGNGQTQKKNNVV